MTEFVAILFDLVQNAYFGTVQAFDSTMKSPGGVL